MAIRGRVINDASIGLQVGLFGMGQGMQVRLSVPGKSTREFRYSNGQFIPIDEGNRVFVAWDDFSNDIKSQHVIRVDSAFGEAMTIKVFDTFQVDVGFARSF